MIDKTVYERINKFHAHLDVCSQCRNHPFHLCSIGAKLLIEAATKPEVYKMAWQELCNAFGERGQQEEINLMDSVLKSVTLDEKEYTEFLKKSQD